MTKFTLLKHKRDDNNFLFLKVQRTMYFGLFTKIFDVIHKNTIYINYPEIRVFYFYPCFKRVDKDTKLQKFLDSRCEEINYNNCY